MGPDPGGVSGSARELRPPAHQMQYWGDKCKQSHTQTHGHTQVNQGNFGLLYCVTQPKNYFKEKAEVQLIISIWDAVTQTSFTVFQETQGTGLNLTPAQPHLCHVTPPAP